MKKFAFFLAFAVGAAAAIAQDAPKPDTAKAATAGDKVAAVKTHDVEAEVVSADATAKTLTIKGELQNKTVPVEGKATAQLKDLKPGEKVTLSCRDNDMGEHQAVVAIKPAKATMPKEQPK
jgi:hypothetical protein